MKKKGLWVVLLVAVQLCMGAAVPTGSKKVRFFGLDEGLVPSFSLEENDGKIGAVSGVSEPMYCYEDLWEGGNGIPPKERRRQDKKAAFFIRIAQADGEILEQLHARALQKYSDISYDILIEFLENIYGKLESDTVLLDQLMKKQDLESSEGFRKAVRYYLKKHDYVIECGEFLAQEDDDYDE